MKSNYKRLGNYIEPIDEFNEGMKVQELLGISNNKYFQKSHTNTIGIDLSKYRVVRNNHFAFNRATTRNGEKISIALKQGGDCIVSPSYRIFKSIDENNLNSEYLWMWFRRAEFDRYARFKSHGSAHEFFDMEEMNEVMLPIPSIEKQRELVAEYNTVQNRIKLNERLIQKLEETAQTIYKQWFVEFEFPDKNGQPYKSCGGEMVWNEEMEKEVPKGWEVGKLSDISKCLDFKRKPLSELERNEFKGNFPYYGAMGIVDYVKDYIFDGEYLLFSEDGVNVIDEKGHPSVFLVWGKFWVNNHAHIIEGKDGFTTRLIYLMLKDANVSDLVTGAAQPKINQENMNSIVLLKPDLITVNFFEKIMDPIFENYKNKIDQNKRLESLKELLLSKLASIENSHH